MGLAPVPQILSLHIDGVVVKLSVWDSEELAHRAGDELRKCPLTGISFYRQVNIRPGVISLDDYIDMGSEEIRNTWLEELSSGVKFQGSVEGSFTGVRVEVFEATAQAAKEGRKREESSKAKAKKHEVKETPRKGIPSESVWGQTFIVPGRNIGEGSYHFLKDGTAYLNYEKMPKSHTLSDGSPYPKILHFTNIYYDPTVQLFQGSIFWDVSTGQSRWDYTMKFFPAFVGIKGTCNMFRLDSKEPYCTVYFGTDAFYVRHDASAAEIKLYKAAVEGTTEEEKEIIAVMTEVIEKDAKARAQLGRGKPKATESMQLLFGQAAQIYARDKRDNDKIEMMSSSMTGAKLGAPTRWDKGARR